jgi:hypothetical protein
MQSESKVVSGRSHVCTITGERVVLTENRTGTSNK